jgi:hypothetical protein
MPAGDLPGASSRTGAPKNHTLSAACFSSFETIASVDRAAEGEENRPPDIPIPRGWNGRP